MEHIVITTYRSLDSAQLTLSTKRKAIRYAEGALTDKAVAKVAVIETEHHTLVWDRFNPVFPKYTKLSEFVRDMRDHGKDIQRRCYLPNATAWHEPNPVIGVCQVCHAGALMASMAQLPIKVRIDRPMYDLKTILNLQDLNTLQAADRLRRSEYLSMANLLQINLTLEQSMKLAGLNQSSSPVFPDFRGWDEYEGYLESLGPIADRFESIGC